jgi:hypothetical protein
MPALREAPLGQLRLILLPFRSTADQGSDPYTGQHRSPLAPEKTQAAARISLPMDSQTDYGKARKDNRRRTRGVVMSFCPMFFGGWFYVLASSCISCSCCCSLAYEARLAGEGLARARSMACGARQTVASGKGCDNAC